MSRRLCAGWIICRVGRGMFLLEIFVTVCTCAVVSGLCRWWSRATGQHDTCRTYYLVCSLTDGLVCSRTDCLACSRTDGLVCSRADCFVCSRTDCLACSRTDCLAGSRTDCLVCSRTDCLVFSRTDCLVCKQAGTSILFVVSPSLYSLRNLSVIL